MTSFIMIIVVSFCGSLIAGGPCKMREGVMDCSRMGLTDCPAANKSVTSLILDENKLTDLRTKNCQNWTNLISLSVRKNKLKNSLKFEKFKVLQSLDLSENQLRSLALYGDQLVTVNISSNFLAKLQLNLPNLNRLFSGNNKLTKSSFGNLILGLHNSPLLAVLDVNRNQIDSLPVELMTLTPNRLLTINLSRNRLKSVRFNNFVKTKFGFNIDISFNQIVDFEIYEKIRFGFLNFSNNQLSKIDDNKMNRFLDLKGIDFSMNPLSCLCNESESFINWMIKNKFIVINPQNTTCKYPSKVQIFEVKCFTLVKSKKLSSIRTTKRSTSKRPTSRTTKKSILKQRYIKTTKRSTSKRPTSRTTKRSTSKRPTSRTTKKSNLKQRDIKTTKRSTSKRSTIKTTKRSTSKRPTIKTTKRSTSKRPTPRTIKRSTSKRPTPRTTKRSTSKRPTSRTTKRLTSKRPTIKTTKRSTSQISTSNKLSTKPSTSKIPTKKVTTSIKPTTKHANSSTKLPKPNSKSWIIILAVILTLLGLVIIFVCYWIFCRHKIKYQRLD